MSSLKSSSSSSILDKPLSSGKSTISLSLFSYLFSEIVQYSQQNSDTSNELESKLSSLGYDIGVRYLELCAYRHSVSGPASSSSSSSSNLNQRPRNILQMLQFIHGPFWRQLFGHNADALEKSTQAADEYYIYDAQPITNKFISVPKDFGALNCASFIAGIIAGVLDSALFNAEVTAHFTPKQDKTVYIIKFDKAVMKRDQALQ
jgi:hypothetical protein